jgi:cellulose synthase/poly-beta-1,6-N-acetylglucosamine synthase-like glycosyltransferase
VVDLVEQGYAGLEIVVVFDGVEPGEELVARLAHLPATVRTVSLPRPVGKTAAQNRGVAQASGEILVFTDAATRFESGAVAALVAPLSDPAVSATCGWLRYEGEGPEAAYWALECALKRDESRFSGLLGANGAIYALRRAQYVPMHEHAITDLAEPLVVGLIHGGRTVFVEEARAWEPAIPGSSALWEVKRRVTLRALAALPIVAPCLDLFRRPRLAFVFVSHKLLRWFCWALALALALGLALAGPVGRVALAGGLAFVVCGARGGPAGSSVIYAITVLRAQASAFQDWCAGRRISVWRPTHADRPPG